MDTPNIYRKSAEDYVGTWIYFFCANFIFFGWIGYSYDLGIHSFDPYPYILLNLVLSYTAMATQILILIGQNKQKKFQQQQEVINRKMMETQLHLLQSMREIMKEASEDLDEVIERLDHD